MQLNPIGVIHSPYQQRGDAVLAEKHVRSKASSNGLRIARLR